MKDIKYQNGTDFSNRNSDNSKNSKLLSMILNAGIVKNKEQANILLFVVAAG